MEAVFCRSCTLFSRNVVVLRQISTCSWIMAGEKLRVSKGQARDGIAYGPLTDKPDWSYADGRPAPETKRREMRRIKSLKIAKTIHTYLKEMEIAADEKDTDEDTGNSITNTRTN